MERPIPQLNLSPDESWLLEKWASYPEFPRQLSRQARVILAIAEGKTKKAVSREVGTSRRTVASWCRSFAALRLDSMRHERRGRTHPAVTLSENEFLVLKRLAAYSKYQGPLTRRVRMILACAEGKRDSVVSQETGMSVREITKWRSRFLGRRLKGLDNGGVHPKPTGTSSRESDRNGHLTCSQQREAPHVPTTAKIAAALESG